MRASSLIIQEEADNKADNQEVIGRGDMLVGLYRLTPKAKSVMINGTGKEGGDVPERLGTVSLGEACYLGCYRFCLLEDAFPVAPEKNAH